MKNTLSRMWRNGLAVLMALCLMVGMVPAAVFAANDPVKYVSLGDSMANGYGLTGYTDVNGYLEESPDAYPSKVAEYFGWDLTEQLAMSAMRAEDLHYILEYPNGFAGDYYTYDEFIDGRFLKDCGGVEAAAQTYQAAVTNADVLTLGIGNANFGVFMLGRITNALGVLGGDPSEDAWINLETALVECDEETKAVVLQTYDALKAELDKQVSAENKDVVDPLVNAVSYAVLSYVLNYAGVIDRIVELNPDVEVIIVGIMNTFSGMTMTYGEDIIDLSAIMDSVIAVVNTYLSALPTALQAADKYPETTFYYAEATNVSMIVDNFANEIKDTNTVTRDRTVEEVMDMVWPMVSPLLGNLDALKTMGLSLVPVTVSDIETYESGNYDGVLTDSEVLSCAVYLAFEQAIIAGSEQSTLSAESFMALTNGLDGVFDGVAASLMSNLDIDAITEEVTTKVTAAATAEITTYTVSNMQAYFEFCTKAGLNPADMVNNAPLFYCYANNIASQDAMVTAFTAKYAPYYTARTLGEDITPVLANALTSDDTMMGLLNLFARMLIGNGIGCHPSADGHDTLAAAVIATYETKYTAKDAVIDRTTFALEALVDLIETYGPELADDAYACVIEQGYIAMLGSQLADLKADLETAITDCLSNTTAAAQAKVAELKAAVAEVEAKILAAKEQLEAKIAAIVAEVETQIAAAKAEVNAEIAALKAELAKLEAELEAAVAELETASDETKATVLAAIEQIKSDITDVEANILAAEKALNALINDTVASLTDRYINATTVEYTPDEDSFYVAIGDSSAVSESYVDVLAGNLGVDYANLAQENLAVEDTYAVIAANVDTIAKADLITVGYTSNTFMNDAIDCMIGFGTEPDWSLYLDETQIGYVDDALAEITASLMEEGIDAQVAALLTNAIEAYAYNCVSYACNLPEVINALRAVNPDAAIIIVGMYNPLENITVAVDETNTLEIGKYFDYLTTAAGIHNLTYAMLTSNAIFVEAEDVTTVYEENGGSDTMSILQLTMEYLRNWGNNMLPGTVGNTYIATQIADALIETPVEDEPPMDDTVMKGDVNIDGSVTLADAMQAFYHVNEKITLTGDNFKAADLDDNGEVSLGEAMKIFYYVNEKIDTL